MQRDTELLIIIPVSYNKILISLIPSKVYVRIKKRNECHAAIHSTKQMNIEV